MPSYVDITHYENYDLQKRWPDTVFIQNPYDQTDPDISIDPRFYSQEIKRVADTLIYVFSDEELSDMPNAGYETAKHCTSPGALNADMIIVNSENIKQLYIDILTKNFGEITRKDWKEKVFSIRSPRLEQIRKCRENEEQ